MIKLCDFEKEVLLQVAGFKKPAPWGAAIGEALGYLKNNRLVTQRCYITEKGWAYAICALRSKP